MVVSGDEEEKGLQTQTEKDTDIAEVSNNASICILVDWRATLLLPNDKRCGNMLCNTFASRLT